MRKNSKLIFYVLFLLILISFVNAGTTYIRANDQLVAKVDEYGIKYYQLDYMKNVKTLVNPDGSFSSLQEFTPFGEKVSLYESSNLRSNLNYRSTELDENTGLYAIYSPEIGRSLVPRFISNTFLPQFLNPYSYMANNPFREIKFKAMYPSLSISEAPSGATAFSTKSITKSLEPVNVKKTRFSLKLPMASISQLMPSFKKAPPITALEGYKAPMRWYARYEFTWKYSTISGIIPRELKGTEMYKLFYDKQTGDVLKTINVDWNNPEGQKLGDFVKNAMNVRADELALIPDETLAASGLLIEGDNVGTLILTKEEFNDLADFVDGLTELLDKWRLSIKEGAATLFSSNSQTAAGGT